LNDSIGKFSKNLFRHIRNDNKRLTIKEVEKFKEFIISHIYDYDNQKFPLELMSLKKNTYKYYCNIFRFIESIENVVKMYDNVIDSESDIIAELKRFATLGKSDDEKVIAELNALNKKYSLDKITLRKN
jgi:hypothetical protein